MEIKINSLEDLSAAAKKFVELTKDSTVFAFYGTMGVGKTTFIKEVCKQLGVNDEVTSPTFAIINEYAGSDSKLIYHFDLYRLDSTEEALNIGVEDYLYSSNICLIEWPEIIENLLPNNVLEVSISESENGTRILAF